jgi:signal transduction histidine kinase/CheY-like chemotaxis protein
MAVKKASPTSLLSEFAIECSGKNDPDEMVEWFLERCIELLQAERGFLISFESPTSFSFTAAKNYEGEQIKKPATQASEEFIAHVIEAGEGKALSRTSQSKFFKNTKLPRKAQLSVLCVPVPGRNELIYLDSRSRSPKLGADDLVLLSTLASVYGPAISGAQRDLIQNEAFDELLARQELATAARIAEETGRRFFRCLSFILGGVQALRVLGLPDDESHSLQSIEEHAQEGMMLFRRLRPLFRTDPHPIFSRSLLKATLEAAIQQLPEDSRIQVSVLAGDEMVSCDPENMKLMFYEVLQNSVDACQDDVCNIDIKVEQKADRISVMVRDDGTGISDEHLPICHRPFFSTRQGDGLGLAISKAICLAHGGRMTVSSDEGGTAVEFCLEADGPVAHPHEEDPSRRILIVSEEVSTAEGMATTLAACGYQIQVCTSQQEAEVMIVEGAFDVMILNLNEEANIEIIEHSSQAELPPTPIVLRDWDSFEQAETDTTYMRKPVQLRFLPGLIHRVITERR